LTRTFLSQPSSFLDVWPRRPFQGSSQGAMSLSYPGYDTMTVIFKETSVEESDEAKTGIIIDYDKQGDVVSIEILDAKKRVAGQPGNI